MGKREDPALGDLEGGELLSGDGPSEQAEPSAPSAPTPSLWPPPPPPSPPRAPAPPWTATAPITPRRRPSGALVALLVTAGLIVLGGAIIAVLVSSGNDVSPNPRPSTDGGRAADPSARESPSLLSPRGMRRALAVVRRELGSNARVLQVRVAPEGSTAAGLSVLTRRKRVDVKRDGTAEVNATGPFSFPSFSLEAVDPNAPSRIESALERRGQSVKTLKLDPFNAGVRWRAFAANSANTWTAYRVDRNGRGLCRLGRVTYAGSVRTDAKGRRC